MMTDKKFDKIMKDANDILNKMPKANNFAHRAVHNPTACTTSWYLEDSMINEYNKSGENPWGSINPVERFVLDCEKSISHLMGALKEMAYDYDSLEQQFNEYKERQPDEKAKRLYDHVNWRGIELIDILVDHDKAHLKVENQKMEATKKADIWDELRACTTPPREYKPEKLTQEDVEEVRGDVKKLHDAPSEEED